MFVPLSKGESRGSDKGPSVNSALMRAILGIESVDLSQYSGDDRLGSHSYLAERPFVDVWPAFQLKTGPRSTVDAIYLVGGLFTPFVSPIALFIAILSFLVPNISIRARVIIALIGGVATALAVHVLLAFTRHFH